MVAVKPDGHRDATTSSDEDLRAIADALRGERRVGLQRFIVVVKVHLTVDARCDQELRDSSRRRGLDDAALAAMSEKDVHLRSLSIYAASRRGVRFLYHSCDSGHVDAQRLEECITDGSSSNR